MSAMIRLLFPFAHTYRRLDLKNRWWHRLAIVMFSMLLLLSGAFMGLLYSEAAVTYADVDSIAIAHGFGSSSSEGVRFAYAPLALLASESPVMAPDKTVRLIPDTQLQDAVNAGGKVVTEMTAPDGSTGWIPNDRIQEARAEGFTIVDKRLRIDVPSVGVVSFPRAFPEAQRVQKIRELTTAVRSAKVSAYSKAGFYFLLTFAFVSYIVQSLYRLAIYVAFGS